MVSIFEVLYQFVINAQKIMIFFNLFSFRYVIYISHVINYNIEIAVAGIISRILAVITRSRSASY